MPMDLRLLVPRRKPLAGASLIYLFTDDDEYLLTEDGLYLIL